MNNSISVAAKIFHWLPRIICILAILFISMFALDAFEPGQTVMQQIGHFLMHLIPSFILILFLIIAWKWEKIGGVLFLLVGIGFAPFIYSHNYANNHSVAISLSILLVINLPFILTGGLFFVSGFMRGRQQVVG